MKSTVVPAQITTVEDKIMGNLTLQQMVLLATPVFVNFVLFAILPSSMHISAYKVVLMTIVACVCALLAVRIKGKILLVWLVTITRYNSRARFYVFNKNDLYMRDLPTSAQAVKQEEFLGEDLKDEPVVKIPSLSISDLAKLESILANPAAKLSFKLHKKRGLHVSITEVER
jgi:hypothetical protein